MLVQAVALLARRCRPRRCLITAVYLGSAEPRRTALAYLAGATVMSLVMGVVLLEILRSTGLSHPAEHGPRYGFRLGLGLLLLVAGAVVARRRPGPDPGAAPGGRLARRLTAQPAPFSAFLVGILLFAPAGVTFLAAVQVIATAKADVALTVLAVILVVVINVVLVWLPIVLYFLAPEKTGRSLMAFNGWLRASRAHTGRFGAADRWRHPGWQRHLRHCLNLLDAG